jgi:hypothetical protein
LSVDTQTGAWKCHRCGTAGLLREYWTERPAQSFDRPTLARTRVRAMNDLGAILAAKERRAPAPAPTATAVVVTRAPDPAPVSTTEQGPADAPTAPDEWRRRLSRGRPLPGTPGADYLMRRGIPRDALERLATPDTMRYLEDWFGHRAVVFFLRGALKGFDVAAHGRMIDDTAKPNKRSAGDIRAGAYWTPGAYRAYVAEPAEPLIITEAPIDALSLAAAGMTAIALCGVALREWAPEAFAGKRVLLAFDADKAGDDAAEEWKAALRFGTYAKRLRPEGGEGGKDWNAMLMAHGPDGLADYLDRALRLIHS